MNQFNEPVHLDEFTKAVLWWGMRLEIYKDREREGGDIKAFMREGGAMQRIVNGLFGDHEMGGNPARRSNATDAGETFESKEKTALREAEHRTLKEKAGGMEIGKWMKPLQKGETPAPFVCV